MSGVLNKHSDEKVKWDQEVATNYLKEIMHIYPQAKTNTEINELS